MTKKQYVDLADRIKQANVLFNRDHLNVIADFFQTENPQFDKARWLRYILGQPEPKRPREKMSSLLSRIHGLYNQ